MKRILVVVLVLAGFSSLPLRAQSAPSDSSGIKSFDIAVGYTTVHANAPPVGLCGCFWMQGGGVQASVSDVYGFGLVFDFGMTTSHNIGNNTGYDLTVATYLAGPRYTYWNRSRVSPYGQVLVGAAHASTNNTLDNGSSIIAFLGGGGLDYRLKHHLSWRVVQAEYLHTNFPNGADNHQDQIRLTSGIVYSFK